MSTFTFYWIIPGQTVVLFQKQCQKSETLKKKAISKTDVSKTSINDAITL